MGYRSDVGLYIVGNEEDFAVFCAALKLWANAEYNGKLFDTWEDTTWGWNKTCITFFTQSVKWYDDYPEVIRIESLWEFAAKWEQQHDKSLSGVFIRIGEETTDIEERFFGYDPPWDFMRVGRYIDVSYDKAPFGERANPILGEQQEKEEVK